MGSDARLEAQLDVQPAELRVLLDTLELLALLLQLPQVGLLLGPRAQQPVAQDLLGQLVELLALGQRRAGLLQLHAQLRRVVAHPLARVEDLHPLGGVLLALLLVGG